MNYTYKIFEVADDLYKSKKINLESELNKLGNEGWNIFQVENNPIQRNSYGTILKGFEYKIFAKKIEQLD